MTSATPSDPLAAVVDAWRLRARHQAAVRLAERRLGRALLAAERAGADLRRLPTALLVDDHAQCAADQQRTIDAAAQRPRSDREGRELVDVVDGYAAGALSRAEAIELLARWPYRTPGDDEAQGLTDSFAVVDAAADAGMLSRDDVAEIRRRRAAGSLRPS